MKIGQIAQIRSDIKRDISIKLKDIDEILEYSVNNRSQIVMSLTNSQLNTTYKYKSKESEELLQVKLSPELERN